MPDEYISREAALKYIKSEQCKTCSDIGLCGNCAVLVAVNLLAKVPAADVAEVVRCASCKYVRPTVNTHTGAQGGIWCFLHDIPSVSPDDYCSRARRKEPDNATD